MTRPGLPAANRARRVQNRGWLAAATLLLAFAPRMWSRGGEKGWFALPQTPLDRASPEAAAQWTFLSEALAVLPPGATYTIFAPSPDMEMNLLMMSLGLYVERGHLPVPRSYYGVEAPGRGSGADYVLDYGCQRFDAAAFEPFARLRGGCVLRSRLSTRAKATGS